MPNHIAVTKNINMIKIGALYFAVENGCLSIKIGDEVSPLTAQQTHALYNLLCDFRLDIISLSLVEQREREKKNKPYSRKKPKMIQVDGQWVEGIELSELEKEQND